jgi:hypothetical protein
VPYDKMMAHVRSLEIGKVCTVVWRRIFVMG